MRQQSPQLYQKHLPIAIPRWLMGRCLPHPSARSMSLYIEAGRGSGKSRLLGRLIALLDYFMGIPQLVVDSEGGTIDNFLDALRRFEEEQIVQGKLTQADHERIWQRVKYVDMAAHYGSVVPLPLLYRLGEESAFDSASRYMDLIHRLDPELKTAPTSGYNAIAKIIHRAGLILLALDCQLTELLHLLDHPALWQNQLEKLAKQSPELKAATDYFLNLYPDLPASTREQITGSLRTKLDPLVFDPATRALLGGSPPGINWQDVVDNRQIVLLDFRHVVNREKRQMLMLWAFLYWIEFIKTRGLGHDNLPFGLIIDELSELYSFSAEGNNDLFATDLNQLINVIARNHNCWLTLSTQEKFQLDEKSWKTLMVGSVMLGHTSDEESALARVRRFYPYDPKAIKRWDDTFLALSDGYYHRIPMNEVNYTPEEWDRLHLKKFLNLGRFQFLVKPAQGEGNMTGSLTLFNISGIEPGVWVNEPLVAAMRRSLAQRHGQPLEVVLAEIEQRQSRYRGIIVATDDPPEKAEPQPLGIAEPNPDASQSPVIKQQQHKSPLSSLYEDHGELDFGGDDENAGDE